MSVLRLTAEQYAAAQKRARQPRQDGPGADFRAAGTRPPSKYRNRATGGYSSAKEARRAAELKLMEKAGEIRNLREQVRYELIPRQNYLGRMVERECCYVADFVYEEAKPHKLTGVWWSDPIVEDTKGVKTPDYIIKRKLMLHVHGIRIRET